MKSKLIKGDCLNLMLEMKDNSVDIVFTSPPYNRKRNDKYKYYNDTLVNYYEFLKTAINESCRVCKGNVFFNIQKNYYNKRDVFKIIGEYYDKICEIFIWEKSNPMPANGFNITNAYEFIIVFGDKIKSNKTYTKNHLTTSVARMLKEHKAIMHNDTAEFFINNFTKKGDIIFDPFMGAGTTGMACKKLNRGFIGMEIDERYLKMAQERIKNN